MANTANTTAPTTTTPPAAAAQPANTGANVQAANAAHVVVWVLPTNPKGGDSKPRFASLTVGNTLGQCRSAAFGFTAADARWAYPRGQMLATAPNSALHKAWVAATAPKAPAKVQAAFVTAAQAALVAQAKAAEANPKQLANLPVVGGVQPAGFTPAA